MESKMRTDARGNTKWKNEYGKYHREDGPAIINSSNDMFWYNDGKLHREDGPAIELYGGTKFWYINDKMHREDGPAFISPSGDEEFYLYGVKHSIKEYKERTRNIKINYLREC